MSDKDEIRIVYSKRGLPRYELSVWHKKLDKHQVVHGQTKQEVEKKALAKMRVWDEMWERRESAEQKQRQKDMKRQRLETQRRIAIEKTEAARKILFEISQILVVALKKQYSIDWEAQKQHLDYLVPKPQKPLLSHLPVEPKATDEKYRVRSSFFDLLSVSRKTKKLEISQLNFKNDHDEWKKYTIKKQREYLNKLDNYTVALHEWETKQSEHVKSCVEYNQYVDAMREDYFNRRADGVLFLCNIILSQSSYPISFPKEYDLEFNPVNQILIIDYQLPIAEKFPTIEQVKYNAREDKFVSIKIGKANIEERYDQTIYQIVLRTVHELFEADTINCIQSIVFNGYVKSISAATGQMINPCILSVQISRKEYGQLVLSRVDPKICFQRLRGIGSPKLHNLTPVAPIMVIERDDERFVQPYNVVDELIEGQNLALIDWEDFEHLVRELFEKEFADVGAEVKVTQASRDGGVDAIIYNPDPIRGGRIFIQAKRYTNVVGLSAVKELYATVIDKGANRGILVTTAYFGSEAYEFKKGKPLTLLTGENLVSLLQKHGYSVRIDLVEAKKLRRRGNNS